MSIIKSGQEPLFELAAVSKAPIAAEAQSPGSCP